MPAMEETGSTRRFRISGVPDEMHYVHLYEALTRQLCLEDVTLDLNERELELPAEEAEILRNVFEHAKIVFNAKGYIVHFQEISKSSAAQKMPVSNGSGGFMDARRPMNGGYTGVMDPHRQTGAPLMPSTEGFNTETSSSKPRPKRKLDKPMGPSAPPNPGQSSEGITGCEIGNQSFTPIMKDRIPFETPRPGRENVSESPREPSEQTEGSELTQASRAGLADPSVKKPSTEVNGFAIWFKSLWPTGP